MTDIFLAFSLLFIFIIGRLLDYVQNRPLY